MFNLIFAGVALGLFFVGAFLPPPYTRPSRVPDFLLSPCRVAADRFHTYGRRRALAGVAVKTRHPRDHVRRSHRAEAVCQIAAMIVAPRR